MATAGATLAITGAFCFAVCVVHLHRRRPEISSRVHGISHYALGPTYTTMTTAFVALAIGLLGGAVAVMAVNGVAQPLGPVLIGCAALGLLVVAAVPVPSPGEPAWRGLAHTAGALLFFVASAAGALAVSGRLGAPERFLAAALAGAVILFLTGMAGVPALFALRGWLQRGCFAAVVAWLLTVGWRCSQ
ncbi:MAG: DUF998 domain-containing protein [Vicinamibacterales bacterium]